MTLDFTGRVAIVTGAAAVAAMVAQAMDAWGRVDILVDNAGILRDKSFAKMPLADFREVIEVHLMGALHPGGVADHAGAEVRPHRDDHLVIGPVRQLNCLAPTAATRMTEGLLPPEVLAVLTPEAVVPAMLWLASTEAPTRAIACAGAGTFEAAHITLTQGLHLGTAADTPEQLTAAWARVSDRSGDQVPGSGPLLKQGRRVVALSFSGAGGSGWRTQYSVAQSADEALAAAEATGLYEAPVLPVWAAHSFGGFR